jgi:hypothetical protein
LVPSADAMPPSLLSVGSQALHPTATFSAPKSDHVVIQIATRPDRASDGEFLSENVTVFSVMTDSEIQTGHCCTATKSSLADALRTSDANAALPTATLSSKRRGANRTPSIASTAAGQSDPRLTG